MDLDDTKYHLNPFSSLKTSLSPEETQLTFGAGPDTGTACQSISY